MSVLSESFRGTRHRSEAPAANRVLHLVHSNQRRGAEVFAAQLAASLEARGVFQNGLCTLYAGVDDGLPSDGLPVFNLEGRRNLLNAVLDPSLLVKYYRVLRKFRPDVIVAHGGDTLKYTACARLLYRRAPTVYRNIGTASFWANTPVRAGLNRLFLRKFNLVVSLSQHTREDFINIYRFPPERVVLIPNGVDTSDFDTNAGELARVETRRALGLPTEGVVLATVGNLSSEKGHQGLLELMGSLKKKGIDHHHLLVVGEGPLRADLERQAHQLDIHQQVHFLGRRRDVPNLLRAADLFILPSSSEGMPAVLIEAGLAALPSVAFDVGGVAEVVEHGVTGLLAPEGDFPEMSQAILSLSRDPQRRRELGSAAQKRCRDLFGMDQVAGRYEAHISDLIRGESPSQDPLVSLQHR